MLLTTIKTKTLDAPSTSTVKENRNLPPIPQYPFEMYAFGELYSDNGKFMKRRGPRTTIKQHQVWHYSLKEI